MDIKILVDTAIKGESVKSGDIINDVEQSDASYLIAVGFAEKAEKPKQPVKRKAKK